MSDIPLIYDLYADEWRPVTQSEVDELCRVKVAYGHLRLMSQSVLSEAQQMALGHPHKDDERDIDAYMRGEDTRQQADYDAALDAMLAELEDEILKHPFPHHGPANFAQHAEVELVERTTKIDTRGPHLKTP